MGERTDSALATQLRDGSAAQLGGANRIADGVGGKTESTQNRRVGDGRHVHLVEHSHDLGAATEGFCHGHGEDASRVWPCPIGQVGQFRDPGPIRRGGRRPPAPLRRGGQGLEGQVTLAGSGRLLVHVGQPGDTGAVVEDAGHRGRVKQFGANDIQSVDSIVLRCGQQ